MELLQFLYEPGNEMKYKVSIRICRNSCVMRHKKFQDSEFMRVLTI